MASTSAVTSLSDKASGDGVTVDFTSAKRAVTAVMNCRGACTGGLVEIQASHDGSVWATLDTLPCHTDRAQASVPLTGAFRYFRARIVSAVTGGGRVDVTFMEGD